MITACDLWAKLERDAEKRVTGWHSLVHHSADVAAVLLALLDQSTIMARLARLAGRDTLDLVMRERLGALAFLHDIGKANRGFRARVDPDAPPIGHIDQLAWLLGPAGGRHRDKLFQVLGLDRLLSWFTADGQGLFDAVFAHHGRPWRSENPPDSSHLWRPGPDGDPICALAPMRKAMDDWFPDAFAPGPALPAAPAFQHAFAGLLMLADWLGSDKELFCYANDLGADRMAFAKSKAAEALALVGLAAEPSRRVVQAAGLEFARTFGVPRPRKLQEDVVLPDAGLVVLEAETGSGKTEAALWRFAHLFARGAVDGLYFALPTRVAATEIERRTRRFRDGLFGAGGPAVVRAVPGQVTFDGAEGRPLPRFGFEWDDRSHGAADRSRWAAEHPKRYLTAQLAVGTVDQALLGAVQVKHAHLRGAALLRHLLVVDEVHASDTYMEGLLDALLRAHLQAGGHALLLSATLGGAMRARLLGTARPSPTEAERIPYPALSWTEGGRERRHPFEPDGPGKQVEVEAVTALDDPMQVAMLALDAAGRGARVLVVRNTVRGAVAVQQALEALAGPEHPALFWVNGVPTLHHGRFSPADRLLLDAQVQVALGKECPEGGRVVVGTQTLEQSLDLDADLLLTDLCPADVLLQRAGRLHRHAAARPAGFAAPRTLVLVPAARDLLPFARRGRHGLGAHVYEDLRIVEATWRLIEAHPCWRIPAMNRLLVERATHPEMLAALWDELAARDPAWLTHMQKVAGKLRAHGMEAGLAVLDREIPFEALCFPDGRLATRLGEADRQVALPSAPLGPFSAPVATLRVPHFWLDGVQDDDKADEIDASNGTISFRLGLQRFRYDRLGLMPV